MEPPFLKMVVDFQGIYTQIHVRMIFLPLLRKTTPTQLGRAEVNVHILCIFLSQDASEIVDL